MDTNTQQQTNTAAKSNWPAWKIIGVIAAFVICMFLIGYAIMSILKAIKDATEKKKLSNSLSTGGGVKQPGLGDASVAVKVA